MHVTEQVRSVARSNNEFALDLYGQLRATDTGNLFFSPASISTALAMTYAGAEGETEQEMAETLNFDLPEDQVHSAFASLMSLLGAPPDESYELRVANRLWGQEDYGFLPAYLETTRENYGAELAQVDFVNKTGQVRKEINAWIEEQTNNKIKDLLPPGSVDRLTRLVLTNAVYFKGKWEHEFDKEATRDAPFTVSPDEQVEVPLMFQKRKFKYGETAELQLLEMGYQGQDLSMLLLLPKKVDDLAAIEEKLSGENLEKWSAGMRKKEVRTYIPRFELTEEFQLNSMLSTLGMPSAFEPDRADFSGMNGKKDLYITAALHKAFVDVNEEGTEAAGATGIVMGITSMPTEPTVFRADHPFIFLIRHDPTGSILFMGRVTNPRQ
ncbi:MAG: serpin family protein [Planctomycetota bacterium]